MRQEYEFAYRLMRMQSNKRIDRATVERLYRTISMKAFMAACKSDAARWRAA